MKPSSPKEGPGYHSGRQHPPTEKVREPKTDADCVKRAKAAREAATKQTKNG